MSNNKKHIYLETTQRQIRDSVTAGSGPRGGNSSERTNVEEPNTIYEGWKSPIIGSLTQSKGNKQINATQKGETLGKYSFSQDFQNAIIANGSNLIYIDFYKQCPDTFFSKFIKKLGDLMGRNEIKLIRITNLNFGILVDLTEEGLHTFLTIFEIILSADNRDDDVLKDIPREIRLVKSFSLQLISEKLLYTNQGFEEYVCLIKTEIYNRNFNNSYINVICGQLGLRLESIYEVGFYTYIKLEGSYSMIIDFISIFDGEEYAFNELRTNVFTDSADSLVDIRRDIAVPNTQPVSDSMPVIYLVDSGLARNTAALNQLLAPYVKGQSAVLELEGVDPKSDHATRMAGIIIYGNQLLNPSVDNIYEKGLVGYANIYSVMIGLDRPKITLYTIPELLYELKKINIDEYGQRILISNFSFNIEGYVSDSRNAFTFMSYLLDLFLFFNPTVLYINSAGNYEPRGLTSSKNEFDSNYKLNYFTYEDSVICPPGDCLNTFVVGSLDNCVIHSGGVNRLGNYTRKSSFDNGIVKNNINSIPRLDSLKPVKRINCRIKKPDIVSPGSGWVTTTQLLYTNVFVEDHKNGTSYSSAYISHLGSQILSAYPELRYATSIEAIIQHFAKKDLKTEYLLDEDIDMDSIVNDRIILLKSKLSANHHLEVVRKEEEVLIQRLIGGGAVNHNRIIENLKNAKTFLIESEIQLGTEQVQEINLLEFLSINDLQNNTTKIRASIVYRALPNFDGGMGYNLINIQGGLSFDGNILDKKRSGHNYCSSGLRNNRQIFCNFSTKNGADNIQGQNYQKMIDNDYILKIHTRSFYRKKQSDLIEKTVNDYIEYCNNNDFHPENIFTSITNYQHLILPYSLVITIESQTDIDLYAYANASVQLSLFN